MTQRVVLGLDIGTSSSKGVLVDLDGAILHTASRAHDVSRPHAGWVEMDAGIWWSEFIDISRELLAAASGVEVVAVGVSGMGPCVLIADENSEPLRPAILYGVDTRATAQIARLTAELGADTVRERGGSELTTQAVGPKLAWLSENEPDVFARARRLFMPSSYLGYQLTGSYVLDHHSASQSTPLYDTHEMAWYQPWVDLISPKLELPHLMWPQDVAGTVTAAAAELAGLPVGIPVIAGTVDAWTEAVSIDAQNLGDLMLMYGTTMFLVNTVPEPLTSPALWGTIGAYPGTRNLAGGMATSGAITGWLKELFGDADFAQLTQEAAAAGAGANGLLMLPYFAGERTPIQDPHARGIIAGLTLSHTRGDLYRAALEATAFGVRHNIESMEEAGATIERIVAVGGGTKGSLWTQIVSDITGRPQVIPSQTIGASYGAAYLAALNIAPVEIKKWNPPTVVIQPNPDTAEDYTDLYRLYRELYPATRSISHQLAERQLRT